MKILTVFAAFSVSCTSLAYKNSYYLGQCEHADWEQVYYKGLPAPAGSEMESLEKACPYNGIQSDAPARARALSRLQKELCTPAAAYDWGRAGKADHKLCTQNPELTQTWKNGYRDHLALQLNYLNNDGPYQDAVKRYLDGKSLNNTNPITLAIAQGLAKRQAADELGIQMLPIKDDSERRRYIAQYSEELDNLK